MIRTKARPSRRKRLALVAGASLLALLVGELALRIAAPLHSYLAGHETTPQLRERFYRALFPSSYRGDAAYLQRFVAGDEDRKRYDPELGWDLDPASNRQRAPFVPVERPPLGAPGRRTRIACIGDSFTFGADVGPTESFPHQLGEWLDVETVNLGVPGYGIDQAILKYLHHGDRFAPDLVVLGVYRSDYTRASLAFTAFAKPKVVHDPERDRFVVEDDHIRSPLDLIDTLRSEAFWSSRILALLRSRLAAAVRDEAWDAAYYARMDRVVGHLLAKLRDDLAAQGTPLLIVQIPSQADFESVASQRYALNSPQRAHLLALYEQLGIPCIDATARLIEGFPIERVRKQLFVQLPSGANAHLSPLGNRVVARWIAEALRDGIVPTGHLPRPIDTTRLDALPALDTTEAAQRTIARWTFDRPAATGDDPALTRDAGPHGLHARITEASFETDADRGGVLVLDGRAGEAVVPSHDLLHLGDRFHIEVTFRCLPDSLKGSRALVAKGGAFSLSIRDGWPAFYGHGLDPEVWHVARGFRVEPGRWHHLVAHLGEGELTLLLDDEVVLRREVSGTLDRSGLPLKIGHARDHFAGSIDEVVLRRR